MTMPRLGSFILDLITAPDLEPETNPPISLEASMLSSFVSRKKEKGGEAILQQMRI
jgi:hypothetical protein